MSDGSALSREELRTSALAGVRWIAGGRVVAEAATLAGAITLAHLVPPAEFGRAAIALVVVAMATVLAGEGLGTPLIQRRVLGRHHLETAALLGVGAGVLLTVVTLLLAGPLIAPVFGAHVAGLVRLAAPIFLISALAAVSHAALQRRLAFRRLSIIEVVSVIISVAVAVGLALAGADASAIVAGAVVMSATSAILMMASAPLVRPRWHRQAFHDIASFGASASGGSLINQLTKNVDYLILGIQLSAAQVGFYYRAYQLGVDYQRKVTRIMMRVAFPIYSRSATGADMRAVRGRIVRAHATTLFPLLALLIAVAPVLIPWMFGDAWRPAVVPTQILAAAGMVQTILAGTGPLVLAAGHPRALLTYNLGLLVLYTSAIWIVAPYGLTAVCACVVAVQLVALVAAHRLLLERLVGIPMRQVFSDVAPAAVSSAGLLAVAVPVTAWVSGPSFHAVAILAMVGASGGAAYLVTLRALFRPAWDDLALLAEHLLRPQRQANPPEPTTIAGQGPPAPVTLSGP